MFNDLQGKVFIVTGAAQGIGRGIALRLGKEKCKVVINFASDRSKRLAEEAIALIKAAGGQAVACQGDVGKVDTAKKLVDTAIAHFGTLHGIVNNAGVQSEYPSESLPVDEWNRIMDINLRGTFLGCQETINYLLKHDIKGSIVNVSSVHQQIPKPHYVHYASSKGGLKLLTETLAREYADKGIRINTVAPGAIDTPMNEKLFSDPATTQAIINKIPSRQVGTPEQVAAPVAWLLSDEASYVTGTTLFADGGMVLY
ncbi:glucose 1-dehydrogenase [Paenibacillus sp. XY044]|uniref:glucose 1-dehydrogenase n=1 Tax=Paenibacillus sp. XY044 TaxID=2026089 RepID=UPI000B998F23|nr:glucose 1-dehydrogenase [Paenibacillus sp. XY044]OZB92120.1 sugar dehydrogenase [Paenibacillus sp. XY044]